MLLWLLHRSAVEWGIRFFRYWRPTSKCTAGRTQTCVMWWTYSPTALLLYTVTPDSLFTAVISPAPLWSWSRWDDGVNNVSGPCGSSPQVLWLTNEFKSPSCHQTNPEYDPGRCFAFVHDLSDVEANYPVPDGSLDVIVLIFVLSALHPDKYELLSPSASFFSSSYN